MKRQFIKIRKVLGLFVIPAMLTLGAQIAQAQVKVGNNPATINGGSALEIESTNKGLLLPRLVLANTTSWGLAGVAAAGMQVYNSSAAITGSVAYPIIAGGIGVYYFDGTGWVATKYVAAAAGTEPWFNVATNAGATANTQNIYQLGNVGIGTNVPSAQLQLGNTTVNRKIVLFDAFNNDHNFYGFGVNPSVLRYQVDGTGADHIWYAAVNATSSNELMRVKGTGNVGIGTPAPASKLDVSGIYQFFPTGTGATGDALFKINGPGWNRISAANNLQFWANGNGSIDNLPQLTILSTGNVGINQVSPNNKLEINQGTAGNSGLRFTQLNSSIPITGTAALLGVNASGDVVVTEGAASRQFLSVARQTTGQVIIQGSDIIPNTVLNTNNTIPYNTTTGVATLTVGKTYLITASLHVIGSPTSDYFGFLQYALVNAVTNTQLAFSSRAEVIAANYGAATASSGTISMIYTPVAGANTIKLKSILLANTYSQQGAGQCTVRAELFNGYSVVEL